MTRKQNGIVASAVLRAVVHSSPVKCDTICQIK